MKYIAIAVAALGIAAFAITAEEGKVKAEPRIFEMRTYYANPGKMTAMHARFRDHTCALFKKHGIGLVGFWSPVDPKEADEKMIYILSYPSKEAADKSWKAFREDPDWLKAKADSEKDGGLVKKVDSATPPIATRW